MSNLSGALEALSFVANVSDLISLVLLLIGAAELVRTRRELQRQREKGETFDDVKIQYHTHTTSGGPITVGIRGLGHATLEDVLVGEDLPSAVKTAALFHRSNSAIFRMPTPQEQDHVYRDFVGWAGTLLPADAVPHVLVILCEKADGVQRRMLRPVLFTMMQLREYADNTNQFETEIGKESQSPRIDASREVAGLLRNRVAALADGQVVCKDDKGFIVGHLVYPSTAGITRRT